MTVAIDILCKRTCAPSDWASGAMPRLSGIAKCPARFKSSRIVITETIRATFQMSGCDDRVLVIADVENVGDLVICAAFVDRRPVLHLAADSTMPATCFAASAYPHSIGAMPIEEGAEVAFELAAKDTAMFRAKPPLGCITNDLVELAIEAHVNISGLRID